MLSIKNIVHKAVILFYVLLSALYVTWRIGFTLNEDQMLASVIFLIADTRPELCAFFW